MPGSTWSAYSARRLMTHECEQYLPASERTVRQNCDLPAEVLGEVVLKQKQVLFLFLLQILFSILPLRPPSLSPSFFLLKKYLILTRPSLRTGVREGA